MKMSITIFRYKEGNGAFLPRVELKGSVEMVSESHASLVELVLHGPEGIEAIAHVALRDLITALDTIVKSRS